MAQEFSYEIVEEIAILSENNKGWRKELNLVAGMVARQNSIFEIGRQTMKKWGKA